VSYWSKLANQQATFTQPKQGAYQKHKTCRLFNRLVCPERFTGAERELSVPTAGESQVCLKVQFTQSSVEGSVLPEDARMHGPDWLPEQVQNTSFVLKELLELSQQGALDFPRRNSQDSALALEAGSSVFWSSEHNCSEDFALASDANHCEARFPLMFNFNSAHYIHFALGRAVTD